MNGDLSKHIKRYDNNNNNNDINSNKMKKIENYSNYNEKRKYNNYTFLIPKKIMKTLLSSMNKNTHLSLNNLNTINFIFQTYEKGMDILQHKAKYRNKSSFIKNCMNQKKFFTNYNPNFSICSISGITGRANEISENYKSSNNEELLNFSESFYKKENYSNLVISHNNFFINNNSMKNIDLNYTRLINKKKNNNKSTSNNNNIRYILKRSCSCKIINGKNLNKSKKTKDKLLSNNNEYDNSNTLLSIKRNKKKCFSYINNKQIKSSIYEKIKINNEKENPLTLKIFTDKYEKEKENFNNILFDVGIDHRKKKFKLEGFIKRFANQHFVEKLYKAKEYSVKKSIIK